MSDDTRPPIVRIEEALREIGILFLALAPLDATFSQGFGTEVPSLLIFCAIGATLFFYSLRLERRRQSV